jgi:voltage-gated potassium channel
VREVKRIWNEILTVLALLFLIAFSYPAFVSQVSTQAQRNIDLIQWISWSAFAFDVGFGLVRSEDRRRYLRQHPLEVASVLLPFLRPLRLLRVISFAGLAIQKVAIGRQFTITIKVALTAFFVAYISAIQITLIERSVIGSNIKTFEDGLWWAITTVTTVGYGDRFPTTNEGRALAVLLMITGISLIGVITASVASWFVRMSTNEVTKQQQ